MPGLARTPGEERAARPVRFRGSEEWTAILFINRWEFDEILFSPRALSPRREALKCRNGAGISWKRAAAASRLQSLPLTLLCCAQTGA
ncbi:hypothetical protein AAFF_G00180540 [Aldrovandia affinis]|uniref:Uncharacterized protein n=1 Tax=Aldrovandia affinis TaxID=143900 RepID=A0AAD7SY98_9TELE|nr:hypothetical protein AAFF_G00180540 [Aldrovandia affinis]